MLDLPWLNRAIRKGSPQPTDDSEHNDPERSDRSESSEQETPSEDSPQSSPQAQAGPSSKPDPRPDAQPAAPYASIFRKNPRKKAPIKRNRSTSYPPPAQQTPGDKTFVHPPSRKQLRSALKRLADHNSGPPAADPDRHAQPPTDAEQDARPQLTSRSGRPLKKPTRL